MQEEFGALAWLHATGLSQAMRGSLWLYPIIEIVHILGFVLLVGSVAMFDLRLLGLSRNLSVQALARHLLRWSIVGLLLIVPAGLMMFSAHPDEFIGNPVFLFKLGLIAFAALNAAIFHLGISRSVDDWDMRCGAPLGAQGHALLSLMLWVAVICCGRLLAYT